MSALTFPKTGPDLLFEAGRYIAGRARKHHLGARRALLAVLIGETDEHSRECLEMAESWFKRQYGSAAALQSMQDESAAGALTACGCWYALELREAAEL